MAISNNSTGKESSLSTEEHTSSSSSNGSSSTPNTPPTPTALPQLPTTPTSVPPQQTSRFGSPPAVNKIKTPRATPTKSRLGAIDEDSDVLSPDIDPKIPERNPLRRLGFAPGKFLIPSIPTLHAIRRPPPKNIYDDIEGPRGEKFADLRKNKRSAAGGRGCCNWRTIVLVLCILLVVCAALAIGLIVGLKVRHKSKNTSPANNTTNPGVNGAFPAGQYSITTYLDSVDTACTSYSSTWRCYPYATYNESATSSLSTLSWIISQQANGRFLISNADSVFSYPFSNLLLEQTQVGTADENWSFNFTYDKTVIPSTPLTSDGASTKCFFNHTMVIAKLYTQKAPAAALANATTSESNAYKPWPHALEWYEYRDSGAGVPDCYETVNGNLGRQLNLNATYSSTGAVLECGCQYTNFFPVT